MPDGHPLVLIADRDQKVRELQEYFLGKAGLRVDFADDGVAALERAQANVMDMARLNAGVLRISPEPVPLYEVAREAAQMLTPAADAKLQLLRLGKPSKTVAIADHDRIRQVLINLIGNAVKFTPPDGNVAVLVSERRIDGARWGEIRVTDSGPGIPIAEQAAVFEPYYRSDDVAALPGVGLGLAISRALVQQMGGQLLLESEVARGSSFIIRLPMAS